MRDREPKIVRWKNLYWSPVIFPADACWPDNPTGDTAVTAHCDHMSFDWQAAAPPHMLPPGSRPADRQQDGSAFRWRVTLDAGLIPAICEQRSFRPEKSPNPAQKEDWKGAGRLFVAFSH